MTDSKSLNLLKEFLKNNNINFDEIKLIEEEINELSSFSSHGSNFKSTHNITINILTDTYELNSDNVKQASNELSKKGIRLGREQKSFLKGYLDYKSEEFFDDLIESIELEIDPDIRKKDIKTIINEYISDYSATATALFNKNWQIADKKKDEKKKKDYLLGLYTRIFHFTEMKNLTLMNLFEYNDKYLKKELSKEYYSELKEYCSLDTTHAEIKVIAAKFYDKYIELLKREITSKSKNNELENELNQHYIDDKILDKKYILDTGNTINLLPTEHYNFVSFNIDQKLFDKFENKNEFYDYLLSTIKQIYRVLENYKVLTIKIGNIFDGDSNIKWELYSILGIYTEHFIRIKEERNFYQPHEICNDMLPLLDVVPDDITLSSLKKYYTGKINVQDLSNKLGYKGEISDLESFVDGYRDVYYGFTFTDCIAVRNGEKKQNKEINFIKNDSELLFVFYKYRIDERKIPCPACGGLKISGNSYPEIAHKSWECKNIICPERSKSNRGKRYSYKSNYMQRGALDHSRNNIVPKNIIKKWRKDIVNISDNSDVTEMLIRYFTFPDENALFINSDVFSLEIAEKSGRKAVILNDSIERFDLDSKSKIYKSDVNISDNNSGLYKKYFSKSTYILRYMISESIKRNAKLSERINRFVEEANNSKTYLIEGDCFDVLSSLKDNSITAAVTSPPYYNAREYSQWSNLYLYLKDIYNIVKQSHRVLKKGGVFLYNIGDICDNENTTVKSFMGNKRMLLGAYTIQLFLNAGFELLDNILWDKGEPQSNRQKNDGKFTPHYQKPLNSYEHMFLFKKPGRDLIMSDKVETTIEKKWLSNIVYFSPVIKINSKGENLFGHTAPFPKDIPDFVCRTFTEDIKDILLDPFSGSLTTGISAYKNSRIGLGIELNRKYIELSKVRTKLENVPLEILRSRSEVKR